VYIIISTIPGSVVAMFLTTEAVIVDKSEPATGKHVKLKKHPYFVKKSGCFFMSS